MTIREKIITLGDLKQNWDSYGAAPLRPETIRFAILFALCYRDVLPEKAHVVPTNSGSIQFEMHNGAKFLELELYDDNLVAYLSGSEDQETEWKEGTVDPDDQLIASMLRRMNPVK